MTRAEALNSAKPILFNTRMVQAILNGQKSCTRRVIKAESILNVLNSPARKENPNIPDKQFIECLCNAPYAAGNILYVRETFFRTECTPSCLYKQGEECCLYEQGKERCRVVYVENRCYKYKTEYINVSKTKKWRPSIHMPKEATRIFLRATDVAVERLQDITTVGIRAEGINECFMCRNERCETKPLNKVLCSSTFIDLWNGTIKEKDFRQYSWDVNPWVWVIKFERIKIDE